MPLLDVRGLHFSYGNARVLEDVDLYVERGEIVTLIGPNGAGKSTLLNVVSHALRPKSGRIELDDVDVTRAQQSAMVRSGCILVPEGRQVFTSLTVEDNLLLGGYVHRRGRGGADSDLPKVYELFPRLAERSKQLAGTLSGGEQQMLAVGRAMMGRPKLMLLDEPSLGLSPQMVHRIFDALSQLRDQGLTILLVEQNALAALRLADRGYLLQNGQVIAQGTSEELANDPMVRHVYLGSAPDERPVEDSAADGRASVVDGS
jgi:branched-chain amino acid transport system ATP-binding protein